MEANSKEELVSLINYLIHHNEHHNQELKELAASIKGLNEASYSKVEEAIEDFKKGNASLSLALQELEK